MDEFLPSRREARQGRRAAVPNHTAAAGAPIGGADDDLLDGAVGGGGIGVGVGVRGAEQMGNAVPPDDMPPRPSRRQGGWADDTPKEKKSKGGKRDVEAFSEVDERLRVDSNMNQDDDDTDIPVIPDLEEVQEEDMATQIAAPPSVQVNRVATYRELDNYFQKHAALFTLDGEIDLKLLSTVLSPETQVFEEDKQWDWDRLFTEVASELQTEWEKSAATKDNKAES